MAGIEPYAPCPCGSGEKFKWCCHKVEAFADRAQRLFESGQVEAAIKVLDEGLRKDAGNAWLLTRKAIMQIREGGLEAAKDSLRVILQKQPKHIGALVLLTRCVLETEGPINGAGMLQQVFTSISDEMRPSMAGLTRIVAILLGELGRFPAALKHLELARSLDPEDRDQAAVSAERNIETSPDVSPWLKDHYELSPPSDHLQGEARARFEDALGWAERGLWAPAAAAFDALSMDGTAGPEAEFNLGLCRLWLGDEAGAIGPIRSYAARLGNIAEAVDLEVLCQLIELAPPDDRVENVQLIWPLRDRDALLAALRAAQDAEEEGKGPIDPLDPESPEVDQFVLLDRPALPPGTGEGLEPDQIPRILGRISVGQEIAALEAPDDGRVNSLGDRFTALAGSSIKPAHPKTKVLGEIGRSTLALTWDWLFPDGITRAEAERLDRAKRAQILGEVWPVTPMHYLGGRTPLQAAGDPKAAVALRAAVLQFEQDPTLEQAGLDFAKLRERLKIHREPAIDAALVDLERLPVARLAAVAAEELDDERLIFLYRRARRVMQVDAMESAAKAIIARPALFESGAIDTVTVYSDLASVAAGRGRREESLEWLERGRQADSPARRGPNAPLWDMIGVRLMARSEPPETWVPELAVVLERHASDPSSNQIILMNLIEMGLMRVGPNPDNPDDILLDSRPLQSVLAEYGPRVTTASGRLGVSAAKNELWTPGGPAAGGGGGGGLWTPGSDAGASNPAGGKSKLIIPGR
ncbi:SEC-C domain-containing protein [Tundrisphaera sp. TA3]|uniref:SEC-C domain-containing protein n=1 Tax=Tundrisphaera sp. TA3 TaxID=3435775 RepID=UPI003EBD2C20